MLCCFSIGFVFCIVQFFLPRVMNVLSASSRSSMVAWNKIACQARNKNPFKLHNPSQDTPWVLRLIWFYEVRIVEKRGWDHPKRLPPLVLVTSWGESLIRIMEWGGGGRMKGEVWGVTSSSMVCPEQSTLNQASQTCKEDPNWIDCNLN